MDNSNQSDDSLLDFSLKNLQINDPNEDSRDVEDESEDNSDVWKKSCHHLGPVFDSKYEKLPDNIKFRYNGKVRELSEDTEEAACLYAKELGQNCINEIFDDNFLNDWREIMTESEQEITDLKECDFTEIHKYFLENPKAKNQIEDIYKKCTIDGKDEPIENYFINGPSLFKGLGENTNNGKIKRRITPNDVTINCSNDYTVVAPEGKNWEKITHNNKVTYLASWKDKVSKRLKYMKLARGSTHRVGKETKKYEKSDSLKDKIDKIRRDYKLDWYSQDIINRQRGVALYFIDTFLFRAGHENNKYSAVNEEAVTYGCCSFRVKHIELREDNQIQFDFLGKSSILYQQKHEVDPIVYKILKEFVQSKNPEDKLFYKLDAISVNNFLNEKYDGLTIKEFRTYNASATFKKYLEEFTNLSDNDEQKIAAYNKALKKIQKLCNHTTDSSTKKNYLDPTITNDWCNWYGIDATKIVSPGQKKFFDKLVKAINEKKAT